ncbi:hypothetical protein BRD17_03770 [Halobacteriales archaeon SW_7_68_16]|nr:MAG: hypothetical protein BRD17_03770 [Halobacteriales archaeon SW_7_68_16]
MTDETDTPDGATDDARPYLVTHADEGAATLRDVRTAQVHTLDDDHGMTAGEVVTARLESGPMGVVSTVVEVIDRREIDVVRPDLEPTRQAREACPTTGEVARIERAGEGEVHVLSVPEGEVAATATVTAEDDETLARAARQGATRVEIRTGTGLVSVRYLPD